MSVIEQQWLVNLLALIVWGFVDKMPYEGKNLNPLMTKQCINFRFIFNQQRERERESDDLLITHTKTQSLSAQIVGLVQKSNQIKSKKKQTKICKLIDIWCNQNDQLRYLHHKCWPIAFNNFSRF